MQLAHPFVIDAMVVMPDHLHCLWTLPENDGDFSTRWGLIKAGFSRQLAATERVSISRKSKGERGVWQRRFWEHLIRDELDFERHVDYIHYNPVKHGYVTRPVDWQFSSIHRYIKTRLLMKIGLAVMILARLVLVSKRRSNLCCWGSYLLCPCWVHLNLRY